MTTVNEDIDAIASDPKPLALESGLPIKVLRIRTRATMSLLKILTRGAGDAISDLSFTEDSTQAEFTGQLLGAVLLAIPGAEDETVEFIQRMVEPGDLVTSVRLTPGDIEWNQERWDLLQAELQDPSLEDLVTIVSEIVKVEGPHVVALGKRLRLLLPTAQAVEEKTQDSAPAKRTRKASASSKSVSKD